MNFFEDVLKVKYPQKPWVGIITTIGAILIFLVVQTVFIIVFMLSQKISPTDLIDITKNLTYDKEMLFATNVIGIGFTLPLIVILLYRKYVQALPLKSLLTATRFRPRLFLIGMAAAIISIILDFGINYTLETYFNIVSQNPEPINRLSIYGTQKYALLAATYLIAVSFQASFEELFFRGFIMQHMRRTGLNLIFATIATSLIFCSFHIGPNIPLSALFTVFMMGLAFQIGTNISQGIEASMGAHITNNFIILGIVGVLDNAGEESLAAYFGGIVYFGIFVGAVLLAKRLWPEDFAKPDLEPVLEPVLDVS